MIQAPQQKRDRLRPTTALAAMIAALFALSAFALPGLADERSASGVVDAGAKAAEGNSTRINAGAQLNDAPMQDNLPTMQKVGEARLKVLLWSVYDSRLYTPSGRYIDGDRPLRLEIQYLRDVSKQALVSRTLVEWQAMGRSHPEQQAWLKELASILPDIQSSDVLALELDQNNVAAFVHNGRALGTIDDPDFGQQFVDIWLSRDCTRPDMRLALLGRDSGD
jgi:hypothetical protein